MEKLSKEEMIAKFEKDRKEKEEAAPFVEAVQKMIDCSNTMSLDGGMIAKHMATAFSGNHRTLQQSMMRVLADFIAEVGKVDDKWTDDRNMNSINWCRRVGELEKHFPFI